MARIVRNIFVTIVLTSVSSVVIAQSDTLQGRLDNVVVVGHRYSSPLRISSDGTTTWNMQMMADLPKILGNADPMHYTQLLPGIQTNGEYDAGMHVQGCESQHNVLSIDGIPLYNVAHMLGFFSVFNASHFSNMQLRRSSSATASANRLGAELIMMPVDTVVRVTSGEISVGPMSSQGTLRLPINNRSSLVVSARNAYLNLLYGPLLKTDEQKFGYTFGDYNATWLWQADAQNIVSINGYYGFDRLTLDDISSNVSSRLTWGNYMASLKWVHREDTWKTYHTLYSTSYRNSLRAAMDAALFVIPSRITDYGYKGRLEYKNLEAGGDIVIHDIKEQEPRVTGFQSRLDMENRGKTRYVTQEYTAFAQGRLPLTESFMATAALRMSGYSDKDHHFSVNIDPSVALQYSFTERCVMSLRYSQSHQYLFQTGFSNMGLPTEFWSSSSRAIPAQCSRGVSLGIESDFARSYYHVSAELYYKKLTNQVEYTDNLLDMLYSTYNLNDALMVGRGSNYGINVMVNKTRGRLTGWVSYSYGRALRRFSLPQYPDEYPSSHERIHELDAVATIKIGRRWSIGGTFVAASGTPFTAPRSFYIINSRLVSEYGPHNGNRLKPYVRLDLSANYYFKKSAGHESGINISVYNVLMHSNDLFYRLKYYEGKFGYRPLRFIGKLLPSINYFYKF